MKELKIKILKASFDRIIKKLSDEKVENIKITNDLYNIIPTDKWDLGNNLDEVVIIGSLYDDIDSIEQLIFDAERPCTYVDFDRVASILRVISQIRNPVED